MNLGPMEIIVILIVALLIFGPKNLPKLGSAVGKTVKNVREGLEGTDEDDAEDGSNVQKASTSDEDDSKEVNASDVVVNTEKPREASGASSESGDADVMETVDEVRFCNKCGAKNAADAEFCNKCGAKMPE